MHRRAQAGGRALLRGSGPHHLRNDDAGCGKSKDRGAIRKHFSSEHTFYRKFRNDIRRPHMRLEANLAWRLHFRETLALIRRLLATYSPEDMRHAELLALCQVDNWDRSPNKLTIEDFLK